VRIRLNQCGSNLVDRHAMAQVRQVRTDRRSSAEDHMTGSALPLTEEELLAGRLVSGHIAGSRLSIQGVHEIGEGIQLPGRQGESRHGRPRNSVVNQIAQFPNRLIPQPAVPCETWGLVCAPGVSAVATDAALRVYFSAFLKSRSGGGRILRPQQPGTRDESHRHACYKTFRNHAASNLRAFSSRIACRSVSVNPDSRTFNIADSK
jgi:hypothetical protein